MSSNRPAFAPSAPQDGFNIEISVEEAQELVNRTYTDPNEVEQVVLKLGFTEKMYFKVKEDNQSAAAIKLAFNIKINLDGAPLGTTLVYRSFDPSSQKWKYTFSLTIKSNIVKLLNELKKLREQENAVQKARGGTVLSLGGEERAAIDRARTNVQGTAFSGVNSLASLPTTQLKTERARRFSDQDIRERIERAEIDFGHILGFRVQSIMELINNNSFPIDDKGQRTEIKAMFRKAGVDPELLIFRQDTSIGVVRYKSRVGVEIYLFDSNRRGGIERSSGLSQNERFADALFELIKMSAESEEQRGDFHGPSRVMNEPTSNVVTTGPEAIKPENFDRNTRFESLEAFLAQLEEWGIEKEIAMNKGLFREIKDGLVALRLAQEVDKVRNFAIRDEGKICLAMALRNPGGDAIFLKIIKGLQEASLS